jgi:putative phosphoesterase
LRVAVLSDTHVPASLRSLPDDLLARLRGVDRILHAGDITAPEVLDRLESIAPTTAVVGNMDPPAMRLRLKERELLQLAGRTVGLAHGHQRHALQDRYIGSSYGDPEFDLFYQAMSAQLPSAEIILFGHFHRPVIREWKGILFINPGSIAPPHERPTFAILDLGEVVEAHIVELPRRSQPTEELGGV